MDYLGGEGIANPDGLQVIGLHVGISKSKAGGS